MLIGVSVTTTTTINMFAHLRSQQVQQVQQALLMRLSTNMRDSVRRQMHPLIQIDQHHNPEFAAPLAEIYMREFACMLQTLKQVNWIASKYHEHAFDNTDAYIEHAAPQTQAPPHEMTTEQRHASQILFGVGKNYSEINVALKMLACDIMMRDVMECKEAVAGAVAKQFQTDSRAPEDAFDRLHHITKQVWSLVNLLAFSNLFRFADPAQPILIANPEDSIFIPYIPMQPVVEGIWCHACGARTDEKYHKMTHPNSTFNLCPTCFHRPTMKETFDKLCEQEHEREQQQTVKFDPSRHVCNECGKKFDPADMHHLIISPETGATAFYLCHACGFKRDYPDEYRQEFPDEDEDDEPAPESDDDNDDEANATYWLKTVIAATNQK